MKVDLPVVFEQIVSQESGRDMVKLSNGSRFYHALAKGEFSFLHSLFAGCTDNEISDVEHLFGFTPPVDYEVFLRYSDGAILYDNTLVIFGVKNNSHRGVSMEERASISLEREVTLRRELGEFSWIPIASVSAASISFSVELSKSSGVRFGSNRTGYRLFDCFSTCIATLLIIIKGLSGVAGLRDQSGKELENDLLAMLQND